MRLAVLALAALAAACGPKGPTRAASDHVTSGVVDEGAAWPLLLAHCQRSPDCDPVGNFGNGKNEASNSIGYLGWFVQTKDRVSEGGEDYGASLKLSLFGLRGVGGEAGRPLTLDELPDSLGGARAKRSTLTIEYRTPSQQPEPYFLAVSSAWVTGLGPDVDEAKVEISGAAGVLYSADAGGMAPPQPPTNGKWTPPKATLFYASRNLRDEPLPKLMAALAKGESLTIRFTTPAGVILRDALYADGYRTALEQATAALADASIAQPIVARCTPFAGKPDEYWEKHEATAAQLVCDPRLPGKRA